MDVLVPFDFWAFMAGLGLFLFGMYHLEEGLKGLAGRSFKRLLQRFTNRAWKGVLTGAGVTAVLQSSSLVMLLVAAFVGAGFMNLQSALGVVLGANLGTTATAWLVATLGFKLSVANLSFPFLALGILSYLMLNSRPVLKNLGSFFMGFGLLFLGLDFMKTAIEEVAGQLQFSDYAAFGLGIYLLLGLVITALIQSSSATIVIVLSALYAQLIDLNQAVALIIGSNIGTSSTLILASLKGGGDQKRLAFGNVFFKLITGLLAFAFLRPMVAFTQEQLHFSEPLMELVFLNSIINLLGIVLFMPFIPAISRFMGRRFRTAEAELKTRYVKTASTAVPGLAIQALDKELQFIFKLSAEFLLTGLRGGEAVQPGGFFFAGLLRKNLSPLLKYQNLKDMEDEVTLFYNQVQQQSLSPDESRLLDLHMQKLRLCIYAAKNTKDIQSNIAQIRDGEDALAQKILEELQNIAERKIQEFSAFLQQNQAMPPLRDQTLEFNQLYHQLIAVLYGSIEKKGAVALSTITIVIKKVLTALEDLAAAVAHESEEDQMLSRIAQD